ncbi:Rne/Rng family ribonuclease [Peribacillus sp. SCS-26]|uniref:Rne/Rng family ribonuclease n=1 Tax=Paraperibacillus marinus TaxID=3115295 RepID=UPI003906566B
MKRLIVNAAGREKRFAVTEQGGIVKLEVQQPGQESLTGSVFWGMVTKVLPGMEAAFVDIGQGKHGFLYRDDLPSYQLSKLDYTAKKNTSIGHFVRQGERMLVQVVRDASGNKGPKLSGIIELASDKMVAMFGTDYIGVSKKMKSNGQEYWRKTAFSKKNSGEGMIIRTSMEGSSLEEFSRELAGLRMQYAEIKDRASSLKKTGLVHARDTFLEQILKEELHAGDEVAVDDFDLHQALKKLLNTGVTVVHERGPEGIFSRHGIEKEAEKALRQAVWLEGGSYLIIQETEACTVIDVNTGSYTGKSHKEETITKANVEAAREAARQLRLRNIGGIIIIDFINMENPLSRKKVQQALQEALSKDEMRTVITGFTELGMLQLTRKKAGPGLREKLTVTCPACRGSGSVESAETMAFRLERELIEARANEAEGAWIEATADVTSALAGAGEEHLLLLEQMAGKKLIFTTLSSQIPAYRIRQFGSLDEIRERAERE